MAYNPIQPYKGTFWFISGYDIAIKNFFKK